MRITAIYPFLLLLASAYASPTPKPDCNSIATCKDKGEKVWKLVQEASADTPGLSDKYELYKAYKKFDTVDTLTNYLGKGIKALMKGFTDLPDQLKKTTITGKTQGTDAYEHFYASGTIVANNNFRQEDPVGAVNWNVIAFEGYKEAGFQPSDLKYVLRFEISNAGTKAVIEEVYKDAKKDVAGSEWEKWTYTANQNEFLGLLGTPNGNGPGYILTDYAATLKKKIAGIHTKKVDREWSMVVEYT